MTKVWITRTRPGAEKTAESIRALGFEPLVHPLLETAPPVEMPEMPPQDAVVIFTSQNGVRSFAPFTERRHWRVVTVGDATADLAIINGFKDVMSASGAAENVIALVQNSVSKQTPIVHCAGEITRGDIVGTLKRGGYKATHRIFYRTESVNVLPNLTGVDFVLLHSPMAANTLAELKPDTAKMTAVSISEAASKALGTLVLGEKRVANAPNEAALLACLARPPRATLIE